MRQEFKLQDPGEGIHEVDVLEVLVSEGDNVSEGQDVLTVESDKAAIELPSPYGGTVAEIRVKEGDTAIVGDVLIVVEDDAEDADGADRSSEPNKERSEPRQGNGQAKGADRETPAEDEGERSQAVDGKGSSRSEAAETRRSDDEEADEPEVAEPEPRDTPERERKDGDAAPVRASPAARKLAKERGIDLAVGAVAALGIGLAGYYAPQALAHLLQQPDHRHFNGLERLMTQSRVVWHYVSLLLWPDADRLQLDYDFAVSRSLLDPPTTLLAIVALAALAVAAVAGLRRLTWPAFGWLFFLLALSVESSFIMLEMVFEHRVYLPAALLVPALVAPVYGAMRTPRGQRALGLGVIALAGLLTWQTLERNRQWSDFGGFWAADLERGASASRASINAANRYLRQGAPAKAVEILDRLEDPSYRALQQRGEALIVLGRHAEAIDTFRRVLEERPVWSRTAYYTGVSLLAAGRRDDAASMLEQIRRIQPSSLYASALAARLAAARGNPGAGVDELRAALADDGRNAAARIFLRLELANILIGMDRPQDAREEYRRIIERDPKQWVAWVQLYRLLRAGGSTEQAETIARYLDENGIDPGGTF